MRRQKTKKKPDNQIKTEKKVEIETSNQIENIPTFDPVPIDNPSESVRKNDQLEGAVEVDPTYHQKQKKKQLMIGIATFFSLCLLLFIYYQSTHVKLPNFVGKELSESRKWAAENKIELTVKKEYSLEKKRMKFFRKKVKQIVT